MRLSRHAALPLPSLHHHLHRHSPCRDRYLPGVQALARSLQAVGAAHPLLVMHTPDTLSAEAVAALHGEPGCEPLRIQRYRPPGAEGAALSGQGGQEWRRAGGLLVKRAAATAAQQLGGRARQPATGRCCTPLESAPTMLAPPPPPAGVLPLCRRQACRQHVQASSLRRVLEQAAHVAAGAVRAVRRCCCALMLLSLCFVWQIIAMRASRGLNSTTTGATANG